MINDSIRTKLRLANKTRGMKDSNYFYINDRSVGQTLTKSSIIL